jgi:paraquat-inducible protein B
MLWLIPFGALCLCAWFVYRDFISAGPAITIYFLNADGVEEKNTQVKYRGANVGQVTSIELTKDAGRVKITARLIGSARNLAKQGSVYWIVRPEVKLGSISGLRTIISGEYLAVQPGNGPATNTFLGAEKEPINDQSNSLQFLLIATNLGSMQEQTPIFYRGIQVGEVLYYQLAADARSVILHASIWHEYAPLVRSDTKFWNAGGLDVHAGIFSGLQISAESARTLIGGGIEFATPPGELMSVTNGAQFVLNERPENKWKEWTPQIQLQLPEQANQMSNSPGLNVK